MIINGNVATEVEEDVEIPATEELVDGSTTEVESEVLELDNRQDEQNTEQVQEDKPKTYTEEEFNQRLEEKINEILPRRLERRADKIEKEYKRRYSEVENLLKFGFNAENLDEATTKMQEFYKQKGYELPTIKEQDAYDDDYLQYKAEKEAQKIIDLGYDEIKAETEALSNIEVENMTQQEKLLLQILGNKRIEMESKMELVKAGINETDLQDKEYQEFSKHLSNNMSELEKYNMYLKYKPQGQSEKIETMGSMKTNAQPDKVYKEYYTPEEARRLTEKDLDNPKIMEAVEKSMQIWQQQKEQ